MRTIYPYGYGRQVATLGSFGSHIHDATDLVGLGDAPADPGTAAAKSAAAKPDDWTWGGFFHTVLTDAEQAGKTWLNREAGTPPAPPPGSGPFKIPSAPFTPLEIGAMVVGGLVVVGVAYRVMKR